MREKSMDYTFLANLHEEFAPPEDGILSRILHKDEKVNVTLFGFSEGQELSAHSAPTPAILYFLDGEAEVQLGEDKVSAQTGSFVYMPPMLTHGISAKSPVRMLLIQIKAWDELTLLKPNQRALPQGNRAIGRSPDSRAALHLLRTP
jgi:quercetin dioxygenase-like cupin family protein